MRLDDGEQERGARVEMIPLMDVVFLLLVFFIYSFLSMSVQKGVKVTLPQSGGELQKESIQLVMTADKGLFFEEQPVTPAEATARIAAHYRDRARPVLIRADREAPFGLAIELMADLRKAGVERVAYQVSGREKDD